MQVDNEWTVLPIEGARLIRLEFSGDGKRSELRVETDEHPPFVIGLSFASWELVSAAPLVVTTIALDDSEVRTTVEPAAGVQAVLAEARATNPFPEEDLLTWLVTSRDGSLQLEVCVDARLRVVQQASSSPVPKAEIRSSSK